MDDYVSGAPITGYTVNSLAPSSDPVPYPVAGRLYEGAVTVEALGGAAVPLIPLLNARAESGQNYRVLTSEPKVATSPGRNWWSTAAPLHSDRQGGTSVSPNGGDASHEQAGGRAAATSRFVSERTF